jgi:molecular chaperone GrpE
VGGGGDGIAGSAPTGGGEPPLETEEAEGPAEELDPLAIALKENAEYLDSMRRMQAEFENYRKRSQKDVAEAAARALGSFVEQLLPVLDAVDLARAHGSEEVDQVGALLIDLLAKQGLERVDPKGSVFDPTAHEAVVHEEGDDALGVQTVAEVFRAGWRWRGKVLRPAMVKVVG